jgi:hypothetical protein
MWDVDLDQKRVPTGQAVTLTWTTYSGRTPTDPGTLTIGITDGDGTEVVAAGTAVTDNSNGTFSYSLASQDDPTVLVVTFTVSGVFTITRHVEVAGGFLFNEKSARSWGSKATATAALSSVSEYTDKMIREARDRVTDQLEAWTDRSWVVRYCRAEFPGNGSRRLLLSDGDARLSNGDAISRPGKNNDTISILSASIGGTAVTAGNIKADPMAGALYRTDGVWNSATSTKPRNIVVEYTYGLSYPVDQVDRIGLLLLIDQLVPSAISDRAVSFTDELGTVRFETPGRNGNVSTIPEVNAWVKAHSTSIPLG